MLSIRFVSKVKSTLKVLSNHVVITVNTINDDSDKQYC